MPTRGLYFGQFCNHARINTFIRREMKMERHSVDDDTSLCRTHQNIKTKCIRANWLQGRQDKWCPPRPILQLFGLFNRSSSSGDGQTNEGMTHFCPHYVKSYLPYPLQTIRVMHQCVFHVCKTHWMSPDSPSSL